MELGESFRLSFDTEAQSLSIGIPVSTAPSVFGECYIYVYEAEAFEDSTECPRKIPPGYKYRGWHRLHFREGDVTYNIEAKKTIGFPLTDLEGDFRFALTIQMIATGDFDDMVVALSQQVSMGEGEELFSLTSDDVHSSPFIEQTGRVSRKRVATIKTVAPSPLEAEEDRKRAAEKKRKKEERKQRAEAKAAAAAAEAAKKEKEKAQAKARRLKAKEEKEKAKQKELAKAKAKEAKEAKAKEVKAKKAKEAREAKKAKEAKEAKERARAKAKSKSKSKSKSKAKGKAKGKEKSKAKNKRSRTSSEDDEPKAKRRKAMSIEQLEKETGVEYKLDIFDEETLVNPANGDKCAFCKSCDETRHTGRFLAHALSMGKRRAFVHEMCALYSPEVQNVGSGWYNVAKAVHRSSRLKCSRQGCNEKGAAIGCMVQRCNRSYHLPCTELPISFYDDGLQFHCPSHIDIALLDDYPRVPFGEDDGEVSSSSEAIASIRKKAKKKKKKADVTVAVLMDAAIPMADARTPPREGTPPPEYAEITTTTIPMGIDMSMLPAREWPRPTADAEEVAEMVVDATVAEARIPDVQGRQETEEEREQRELAVGQALLKKAREVRAAEAAAQKQKEEKEAKVRQAAEEERRKRQWQEAEARERRREAEEAEARRVAEELEESRRARDKTPPRAPGGIPRKRASKPSAGWQGYSRGGDRNWGEGDRGRQYGDNDGGGGVWGGTGGHPNARPRGGSDGHPRRHGSGMASQQGRDSNISRGWPAPHVQAPAQAPAPPVPTPVSGAAPQQQGYYYGQQHSAPPPHVTPTPAPVVYEAIPTPAVSEGDAAATVSPAASGPAAELSFDSAALLTGILTVLSQGRLPNTQ